MKYWTTKLLIFFLFLLFLISAYNYFKKPFLKDSAELGSAVTEPSMTPPPSKPPKKPMATKEKVAQLLVVPIDVNQLEENSTASARMLRFVKDYEPGFVLYFGDKISTSSAVLATETIRSYFTEEDYMPLIAVDHEGGLVQRLNGDGFTKLEPWQKVVSTYSDAQQKAVFNQSSRELLAVGVNIVFAPVVDLASNSAVLKSRAAADLNKTFQATSNFIYSFSQNGIMPVIKHFPGIGSIKVDPHDRVSTINLSKQDTEIFSKIFNLFSNIGVMSTHVRLEGKLAGKICTLSEECLGKFAEFYPKIILFTDDLTMGAAREQALTDEEKDLAQIAIEAIEAGNNALVFGRSTDPELLEKVAHALQSKYDDSESFRKKVDSSVAKIISLKK
jgi:beta-N-acetylhexosaminidase